MELNLELITRWVETDELDEEFSVLEGDPDWFEVQINNLCDDWMLLTFASNRNSSKREYFANLLAISLCWIYRANISFPFHFSRLQGLKDQAEYEKECISQISIVYEKCRVLDEMRKSDIEEIKILSDKILEFRHDRLKIDTESYYQLVRELARDVFPKYRNT